MRAELVLALSLVAVGLAGCTTQNPSFGEPGTGEQVLTTLDQGSYSGVQDQETHVVQDQEAWEALWARHQQGPDGSAATDPAPRPTVDFSKEMVLAAFQGTSGNTCYGVELTNASYEQARNAAVVRGIWYVPAADAVCGEALTSPFHIVKAPLYTGEVAFEMETAERGGQEPGEDPEDGGEEPVSNGTDVATGEVDTSGAQGLENRSEHVVRDQASWEQLWTAMTEHRNDRPPVPEVDFAERMVVAIFKGQSPDGCHGAQIQNVSRAPNGSYVVEGAYVVIEGGMCIQAITYPFDLVTVPYSDAPVVFQIREETQQADGDGDDQPGEPGTQATFETIERGQSSGVEERQEVVIREQAAWEAFWANHTSNQEPAPDRPQVDFSERMVVAIFKGQSPDTCHHAEIEEASWSQDGALVIQGAYYEETGSYVGCGDAITHPFHIVELDRYTGTVAFDIAEEEREA